ncbi:MAG: transglutaminase-like domain-containing protein [Chloroflexi bacterium]|nr:transglutaminase-like domain-containing protein [Chloroflexota bacterium]
MKQIKYIGVVAFLLTVSVILSCTPRVAPVSEYAKQPFDPRGLITVSSPQVQSNLKAILSGEDDVRTDFRRIQDWVAANIVYDLTQTEYWQWPSDTLNTKKGDCKDYSTLLCTLWRAYGVPASDVYVAIGQSRSDKRHAFLIEKYITGKWQVVEPQVGGFILSELSAVDTSEKYAITFLFNDVNYISDPSSIFQIVRGNVVVSTAIPAVKKPPPTIKLFTVERSTIPSGESTRLNWNVSGATYVGIDQGVGGVSPTGTCVISPIDTAEYRLVAMNNTSSIMASLTVKVIPVAYPQHLPQSAIYGIGDEQKSFMLGFDGWYTSNENVEAVKAGQQVTARMTLKDGRAGQYIMRVWRAIGAGHDEILTQSSFIYDGVSAYPEISFSPSYAMGEAGTRGYWVDLLGNGEQVWAMPNTYPPRLVAFPRPVVGPLDIGFIGWYTGVDAVATARVGQQITTGITLAGGDEGKYVLYIKRDTVGLNDESVGEIAFIYDGTSAIQEIIFSPEYATQEAATRGYYLELYKDGKYLWSLGGSYPPRLSVTR